MWPSLNRTVKGKMSLHRYHLRTICLRFEKRPCFGESGGSAGKNPTSSFACSTFQSWSEVSETQIVGGSHAQLVKRSPSPPPLPRAANEAERAHGDTHINNACGTAAVSLPPSRETAVRAGAGGFQSWGRGGGLGHFHVWNMYAVSSKPTTRPFTHVDMSLARRLQSCGEK